MKPNFLEIRNKIQGHTFKNRGLWAVTLYRGANNCCSDRKLYI